MNDTIELDRCPATTRYNTACATPRINGVCPATDVHESDMQRAQRRVAADDIADGWRSARAAWTSTAAAARAHSAAGDSEIADRLERISNDLAEIADELDGMTARTT